MSEQVRQHYELYPYPHYPLLASVRACDTYALNVDALWARFNGRLPAARRILIAGCGSFSPYPFAVANPEAAITALDLSRKSLDRARLHCLLHGRRNVAYRQGDLLDREIAPGPFEMIDAYGVLHHLDDPSAGLRSLAERLTPGGIMRIMLYSRYSRREEESIRRSLRLLGVRELPVALRLFSRARKGSRLWRYLHESDEADYASGLADALLHPRVTTYRIGEVMELCAAAGLLPLLFAHWGALDGADEEVARVAALERERRSPGNFVLYLGRDKDHQHPAASPDDLLVLNPCLAPTLAWPRLTPLRVQPRLGQPVPDLDLRQRAFLRRFKTPVTLSSLTPAERDLVQVYTKALFLLQYRA